MARVQGVRFHSNKDEVLAAAENDIQKWLIAVGQDAAHTAAERAPVDIGNLKNSISWATQIASGGGSMPNGTPEENTVYIGTNIHDENGHNYAIDQEFGTGIYAGAAGRKTPWRYKDRKGKWHTTTGVEGKHFIRFGVTAHSGDYKTLLESILKRG